MKLIMQPEGSNLCGQACVAMVADISLESSIAVFGKRGKTRTRDLVAALDTLGINSGIRLIRLTRLSVGSKLPPTCIAKIHWQDERGKKGSHWIVRHDGKYYDPAYGVIYGDYPQEWGRLTSLLEVY